VALMPRWGRIKVALGELSGAYQLPINTLWGGFDVALGGFARLLLIGCWLFEVGCSVFSISIPNTTCLPRLPRGGLEAPWTNPGHTLVP